MVGGRGEGVQIDEPRKDGLAIEKSMSKVVPTGFLN
jgi:hypothetical protein